MDLSGHENNSANNRPDLTIPMPSCLVAGAMAAAAQAAVQAQDSKLLQPNKQLILSNNGNAGAAVTPGSTPAATTVVGVLATATPAASTALTPTTPVTPMTTPGTTTPDTKDGKPPLDSKKVRYRECLKNHAAGIGGHALDGCGEFMPNKEDETSMLCAACDCHRNFHRREVEGEKPAVTPGGEEGSARGKRMSEFHHGGMTPGSTGSMKKRFRTKFSSEQKERMYVLSEKLGWRIQKHDEAEVAQFCADTGVKRHVLKVWMHNNKHTFGNKRLSSSDASHEPT